MDKKPKSLIDNNEEGFILNESGTTVLADHQDPDDNDENKAQEGSKSDPQLTELDGLKKGGVEPNVHPEDKEQIKKDSDEE